MARRDPSLIGQEFEITQGRRSLYVKVVKSHLNDGYGLHIKNESDDQVINFENLCEEFFDEVPAIYSEEDVIEVLGKIFEDEVEEVDSVPEWDNSRKLKSDAHREQLRVAQDEVLSGTYVESHAKVGDILFLRFGNIVMRCEAQWLDT